MLAFPKVYALAIEKEAIVVDCLREITRVREGYKLPKATKTQIGQD